MRRLLNQPVSCLFAFSIPGKQLPACYLIQTDTEQCFCCTYSKIHKLLGLQNFPILPFNGKLVLQVRAASRIHVYIWPNMRNGMQGPEPDTINFSHENLPKLVVTLQRFM